MSSLVHLYVCIYLNNWTNSACFLCKYQAFFFSRSHYAKLLCKYFSVQRQYTNQLAFAEPTLSCHLSLGVLCTKHSRSGVTQVMLT